MQLKVFRGLHLHCVRHSKVQDQHSKGSCHMVLSKDALTAIPCACMAPGNTGVHGCPRFELGEPRPAGVGICQSEPQAARRTARQSGSHGRAEDVHLLSSEHVQLALVRTLLCQSSPSPSGFPSNLPNLPPPNLNPIRFIRSKLFFLFLSLFPAVHLLTGTITKQWLILALISDKGTYQTYSYLYVAPPEKILSAYCNSVYEERCTVR